MSTLTQVRSDTYRINHPQTNAALTRMGGVASPKLHGRIVKAVGSKDVEDVIRTSLEFRRGNKSKHWYVRVSKMPV